MFEPHITVKEVTSRPGILKIPVLAPVMLMRQPDKFNFRTPQRLTAAPLPHIHNCAADTCDKRGNDGASARRIKFPPKPSVAPTRVTGTAFFKSDFFAAHFV